MSKLIVFISYSREDKQFVDGIFTYLTARSFNVWVDRYKIQPGKVWPIELENAIHNADIVLFVHSSHSKSSKWVRNEIDLAQNLDKPIIPIKIDKENIGWIEVINVQNIDFWGDYDKGLTDLQKHLETILHYFPNSDQSISEDDMKKSEDLLSQGKYHLDHRNFIEAISFLQKATQINPQLFAGWFYLGQSFYHSVPPQIEQALIAYEHALNLQPNHAQTLNNIGLIFEEGDRLEEALVRFNRALQILPDDPEILSNRGIALARLGRLDDALVDYDHAIQIVSDDPEILNNRGRVLEKQGRFGEALAAFDKALRIRPEYSDAQNNRNRLLKPAFRSLY